MKRTALIAVLAISLTMSACGNGDDDDDTTTTTREPSTTSSTVSDTTSSTVPAFTPSAVSGLRVWLRADAGVNSASGNVRIWEDQSGNGLHAARPVVDRQPRLVPEGLNGKPAIRFDGVNDALAIPFNLSKDEHPSLTIFTVFSSEPVERTQFRKLYGHDDRGFDRATGYDNRQRKSFGFFAGTGVKDYFDPVPNAPYLTADVWGPTTFSGYVNGRPEVTDAPQATGNGNATMVLGAIRDESEFPNDTDQARALGLEPWKGLIAEFLIYDRALSQEERQRVETHLKAKYGIN